MNASSIPQLKAIITGNGDNFTREDAVFALTTFP